MPSSLENAIARNQALTDSGQKVYSAELPPAEAPLPPPLPTISGLPIRGVLPSSMTESTDFANTTKQGGVPMRSGIFPPQAQPLTTTKTTVVVGAASSSAPAATLALSTNNMTNPVQNKINFIGQGGITITSDSSGNEIFTGAPSGATVVGPGYSTPFIPTGIAPVTNYTGGVANGVGGVLFALPYEITTGQIQILVDSALSDPNSYDIGIYGPFTGVETTLPLLANTGPTPYSSNGVFATVWLQGTVTLAPGSYFIYFTTAASANLNLRLSVEQASAYIYPATSITTSSGGVLPATIVPPTASPTVTTGVNGANIPSPFQFNLY